MILEWVYMALRDVSRGFRLGRVELCEGIGWRACKGVVGGIWGYG